MDEVSLSKPQPPAHVFVFSGFASTATATATNTATQIGTIAWSQTDIDWLEFSLLAAQWKREMGSLSSIPKKVSSRLYRRIIEMGRDRAVPQILRQVELEGRTPSYWWPALRELTGEDPVPPAEKRDIGQVAKYWIEWGRMRYGRQLGP